MNRFILLIIALSMGLLAACGGGGSSSAGGSATTLASVSPGDTLPLGTTVSASASGTYNLPAGAQIITTRCIGQVTLAIPGAAQNNTCRSR